MQLLNALVAVTGDRNNMVLKTELTPPEILLLQQLHGPNSITAIEPTGEVARSAMEELERLKWLYPLSEPRITNIWRDYPGTLFPVRIDMLTINPALLKSQEASAPYVVDAVSA